MKVFGSISRLVSILFRKDSQDITLRPNQGTTYTASRDVQLPPGDAAHVIVSADSTQTLTNKTIDGDDNTIQDLALSTLKTVGGDANEVVRRDNTGAVVSGPVTISDAGAIAAATQLDVDNLRLDGNTVSSTDTNGNIVLDPNGTGITSVVGALQSDTSLILQDPGVGTNSVTLQAPTLSGSYTLTLPTTDGNVDQVLRTDGSGVLSWVDQAGISAFTADWVTADGTTKVVTHSLGTKDIQVEIYDKTNDETIWVDTVIRTDTNTLTLTSSEAPGAAGWRVTIHAT